MLHLFTVKHTSRLGTCGYSNQVAAESPAKAVEMRADELGIGPDEPYDVTVERVDDPEGFKVARWIERFGN